MSQDRSERLMIEELKIIQDIIKRMSGNSFLLKGWSLTLIVSTLLFKVDRPAMLLLPIFLLIMFWSLDAYYLRQEKLFRQLHKWVATKRLITDEYLFDMSTDRVRKEVGCIFATAFSRTLWIFYTTIGLLILGYWFFVDKSIPVSHMFEFILL